MDNVLNCALFILGCYLAIYDSKLYIKWHLLFTSVLISITPITSDRQGAIKKSDADH